MSEKIAKILIKIFLIIAVLTIVPRSCGFKTQDMKDGVARIIPEPTPTPDPYSNFKLLPGQQETILTHNRKTIVGYFKEGTPTIILLHRGPAQEQLGPFTRSDDFWIPQSKLVDVDKITYIRPRLDETPYRFRKPGPVGYRVKLTR
jgi:hypothetical protein